MIFADAYRSRNLEISIDIHFHMAPIIMTLFVDDIHQQVYIYGWILLFDHAERCQHLYRLVEKF